jgi:hypothetical protein
VAYTRRLTGADVAELGRVSVTATTLQRFVPKAHEVREGGPRRLWGSIEAGMEFWRQQGEPGWDRFGLTVQPTAVPRS